MPIIGHKPQSLNPEDLEIHPNRSLFLSYSIHCSVWSLGPLRLLSFCQQPKAGAELMGNMAKSAAASERQHESRIVAQSF